MSQVSVTIAGQNFRLNCDPGEEEHVVTLSAQLDDLIAQVRQQTPQLGELRLSIMASLTLADDNARLKKEVEALQARLDAEATSSTISQERLYEILARTTERVEHLTRLMDGVEEASEA